MKLTILAALYTLALHLDKQVLISCMITTKHFINENTEIFCGKPLVDASARTRIACSLSCLSKMWCSGILFTVTGDRAERCKLIFPSCAHHINLTDWKSSGHYALKTEMTNICNGGITGSRVADMWNLPCPRLYFSLDSSAQGTAGGANAGAISFPGSDILGNTFYLPNPAANLDAYFMLGYYPNTDYCFIHPANCPQGITMAFYLNILHTNTHQGFISTQSGAGSVYPPGIRICLLDSTNDIRVNIRSLNYEEYLTFPFVAFNNDFGIGKWVHVVVSYKYDTAMLGNNIKIYMDGQIRLDAEQNFASDSFANIYNGYLAISHYWLGTIFRWPPSMKFDEMFIWEQQLSNDDIYKLYESYLWVE